MKEVTTHDNDGKNGTKNAEIKRLDESEKLGHDMRWNADGAEGAQRYVPGLGFRRYGNALANAVPIRRKNKKKDAVPLENAGLFSFLTYSWLSKYIYGAYKKGFSPEEWPSMPAYDGCDLNADRLELLWRDELTRRGAENASFVRVVWRFTRTRFLISNFIYGIFSICAFLGQTLVTQKLLEHIESPSGSYEDGIKWALILMFSELMRWFLFSWSSALNVIMAMRLKKACMIILYRKVIGLSHLGNANTGELVNLFGSDSQRIFDMLTYGPLLIGGPILIICGTWYLIWLLGPIGLIGMLVFLLYIPIQIRIARHTRKLRTDGMQVSDERIHLTNEILDCVRLIKLYAWEKCFNEKLLDVRTKELKLVFATNYYNNITVALSPVVPIIATILTFLAYVWTGGNLTVAQAFPISTFLSSQMIPALFRLREGLQAVMESSVSFGRLKRILVLENKPCTVSKPIVKSQAVAILRGTFSYDATTDHKTPSPVTKESEEEKLADVPEEKIVDVLHNVTLEVDKGKLIGICGQVGSGKSSLLLAALGQLGATEGQVMRDGSCAYVSQQAWIMNATLKDNILFGKRFDAERYGRALHACNLTYDLEMMPGGDQTEIGERGINLSGGQKQRVALARALYADRDIYFLDDPLSAVDAHVGLHIFNHLITGALRGKTVLFVTHQLQYLNRCDDVYMMRNGRIAEHGTHEELMKMDQGYASMVNSISSEKAETKNPTASKEITEPNVESEDAVVSSARDKLSSEETQKNDKSKTTLIAAEKNEEGTIKRSTYLAYVAAAGGWFAVTTTLLLSALAIISISFSSWWLAEWLRNGGGNITDAATNMTIHSDNINDNPDFSFYQSIYAASIVIIIATNVLRTFVLCKVTNRASYTLHNNLFARIITSPMRFFDTTPAGRIQNLFSRDMDEVDNKLPINLATIITYTMRMLVSTVIITMIFPWALIPTCLLVVTYYFIIKLYRGSLRGMQRMESTSRSPVFSHVTATIQGLNTIHAFEKNEDFKATFSELVEKNNTCFYMVFGVSKWLGVRVDGIATLMPCTIAFLAAFLKGHVSPALVGLAMTNTVYLSSIMQYLIQMISQLEMQFIGVERISRYVALPETDGENGKALVKVKPDWPIAPVIEFENVFMSYGQDEPSVLNGVSFAIEPYEKIGIVGRTGSGKSSLTVALFRLVELSKGRITIDDVDISEVGLEQLRSRLSIIPQDPILFSGTIRSNLDPFKTNSDSEIWEALEKTKLKDRVQSIAGQLDATVGFGGDNLSVGERQLLCLARALLRHTKILVLDEATAAVDPETETVVQNTIQQAFVDSTVLTIAHRLQTVVTCDRVLVMDDGKVAEFDTPANLLADETSRFAKMMEAAEEATHQ